MMTEQTVLYEHEAEDAVYLLREAMRMHEQKSHGTDEPQWHAMMARKARSLLQLLNPKQITHH